MTRQFSEEALAMLSEPQRLADAHADFERSTETIAARLSALTPALKSGDSTDFYQLLGETLDDPAFDAGFERACERSSAFRSLALHDAMRGASVIWDHLPDSVDRVMDVFVIPLHGPTALLEEIADDPMQIDGLATALSECGLVREGARIALAGVHVRPEVAARMTPGTLRDIARGFWRALDPKAEIADWTALAQSIEDAVDVFTFDDDARLPEGGLSSVLVFGAHSREYDLKRPVVMEGLTAQVMNGEVEGDAVHELARFRNFASQTLPSGVVPGNPEWLGMGCAVAVVEAAKDMLAAEASFYGIDLRRTGMDHLCVKLDDGLTYIDGTAAGHQIGPAVFVSEATAYASDWAAAQFEGFARAVSQVSHVGGQRPSRSIN
jgi:hypothetical protein